jgi:hypothetical protein
MPKNDNEIDHTKDVEAKKLILSNVCLELTALGDMVENLLMDPEDMEEGTPIGVKLIIKGIKEQIWDVLTVQD